MTNVKQWLQKRSIFTDWLGDHETFDRKMVNLDHLSSSSGAVATHPLPMQMLRWVVGLQRTGGILYNSPQSNTNCFFEPAEPVGVGGQWLLSRDLLSDWFGDRGTFDRKLVSLENQVVGFSPSPLTIGMLRFATGFIRLGGITYPDAGSRTTVATAEDDLLLDSLSDEELHALISEDTGEPLGLG